MIRAGNLFSPGTVFDKKHVVNALRECHALVAGKRGDNAHGGEALELRDVIDGTDALGCGTDIDQCVCSVLPVEHV